MKTRILVTLALVALSCISHGADSLDIALRKLEPNTNKPIPKAQIATANFSYGLIDKNNVIQLSSWEGGLKHQGTFDAFQTILAFTDPTANRTITFPDASGTVVYNPVAGTYVFEGDTADAFETTLAVVDPTADGTIWFPNTAAGNGDSNMSVVLSTINSGLNAPGLATSVWTGVSALYFEGATADTAEAALDSADVTADVIYRLADAAAGTYGVMASTLATNAIDIANSVTGTSNGLRFEGATADTSETTVTVTDPTADRTITYPDASGTVRVAQASTTTALTADNQAVTPGQSNVLQLTSDDGTATNRTFTLSATGAITGAIYVFIGPASNQCEIAVTGIQKLSATWSPTALDTLTVIFDGTNFVELARSNN